MQRTAETLVSVAISLSNNLINSNLARLKFIIIVLGYNSFIETHFRI